MAAASEAVYNSSFDFFSSSSALHLATVLSFFNLGKSLTGALPPRSCCTKRLMLSYSQHAQRTPILLKTARLERGLDGATFGTHL